MMKENSINDRKMTSVFERYLTLFINWAVKPFTMYGIAILFLGVLFRGFIGADATDLVKMPFGLDLPVGANHGAGAEAVL